MNYKEYYLKARDNYEGNQPSLESFYTNPVRQLPVTELFSENYHRAIRVISTGVKMFFDAQEKDPKNSESGLITYDNIFDYKPEIDDIVDELVPFLEKTHFGCHLFVDKIYIFRTVFMKDRKSSYIWHYDNNPDEVVKNIIYLSDVAEDTSPFEYLSNSEGKGIIFPSTRTGPEQWRPAPNGSRIPEQVENLVSKKDCKPTRVLGPVGTTTSFCSNAAHRANPRTEGGSHRDVLNIRVRPTIESVKEYFCEDWTTSYETTGVVSMDPSNRAPYGHK